MFSQNFLFSTVSDFFVTVRSTDNNRPPVGFFEERERERERRVVMNQNGSSSSASKVTMNNNKKTKKKKRKRKKIPVVESWRTMTSRKRARKVTSEFHKLYAKKKKEGDKEGKIQKQIQALGGHRAYQEASVLSTAHNRTTSRWVFKYLSKEIGTVGELLKTLEIGAINTHISACPWMDVTAIDLNSLHPKIRECDFFDLKPESSFDVVVCAMVLNFVPTCAQRGEMLLRIYEQLNSKNGYLFLVLPIRCVNKSKFMDRELLLKMMSAIGFELKSTESSPKIVYMVFKKQERKHDWKSSLEPYCARNPAVIHRGRKRTNEFSISFHRNLLGIRFSERHESRVTLKDLV